MDTLPRIVGRNVAILIFGLLLLVCIGAGVATGIHILRAGLAPTPPPSMLGVITRLSGILPVVWLWRSSRRWFERVTILTFVIGAGASVLIGFGIETGVLDATRVIYHLLMFSCAAIAIAGSLRRTWSVRQQID